LKHERVTEEVRELTALYALGALTQHEAYSFEIHLPDCSVCKSELCRLEHAVAGIGLAAEEIETPEYVRDLLLARIEREPQVSVSIASSNPNKPALNTISRIDESRSEDKRRGSKLDWTLRIAFVILVFANLLAFTSLHSTQALNARLQTQISDSKIAIVNLRKDLEDNRKKPEDFAQILEVTGKPGMRIAWLAGQPLAPSSSGMLFWDTGQGRYLLMGSFPPTPPGMAYQLWLVTHAKKKVSAGLIKTNPDGSIYTAAPVSENPKDAIDAGGITLEPESGSSSPTTHFYALGPFS
jgi:hypothetical protein